MSWQALGHTVKNTEIKSKTLGPRDDFIGGPLTSGQAVGPDKPYGLVGYFDPKLPSRPDGISDADWDLLVDGGRRPPGMPEGEWDAVKQEFTADVHRILDGYVPAGAAADVAAQIPGRFAQRRLEFEDNAAWYGQLVDEGKIEIRDGVVWNTGLYRGKHAGITGDIDVFEVFGLDGRPLEIEQYIEAMEYLKAHPELLIRHGAHMRWPIEFPFENSKDKGIFTVIVKSHEGKEPILLVGGYGDGLIRATYTRNGSLVTATDGRVLWSPDGGWIAPHSFGAPTHVGVAVQVASALPSAAGVDGDSGRPDRPAPTRRAVDETSNSVPADRTGQADVDDDGAELGMVDEAPRSEPDHVWRWPQVSYFRELIDAAAEAAIAGGRPVTSDGWTWLTAGEVVGCLPESGRRALGGTAE